MITFHQLRKKLADVKLQYTDVFESFKEYLYFAEESTFYIYRTDTNAVLARGVQGFEQAPSEVVTALASLWRLMRFLS